MFNCTLCNKSYKTKNALSSHIGFHNNPNRNRINNWEIYNKKIKYGESKLYKNQFDKAIKLGLKLPIVSEETRKKIGEKSKLTVWSEEKKKNHSVSMLNAVSNYPESYSSKNISGRTKKSKVIDSFNNEVYLNGTWEFCFMEYLNSNKIKWTSIITETINYIWEGKIRRYFPDFYLPDYKVYVEIKGYQRDRDLEKWNVVNNLIVLKYKEIKSIQNGTFILKYNDIIIK